MEFITKNRIDFHNYLDDELALWRPQYYTETTQNKHYIIRERELKYRFYLHQHPYAKTLIQKLLNSSIRGAQGADTEYVKDSASLPGSIKLMLKSRQDLTINRNSRIKINEDLQIASNGAQIDVITGMVVEIINDTVVSSAGEFNIVLIDGMANTPEPGEVQLNSEKNGYTLNEIECSLKAHTNIVLYDGTQVIIPSGKKIIIQAKTEVLLPAGTQAVLKSSSPLPIHFSDFFLSYAPNKTMIKRPFPVKDLDFASSGAYSVYNWEFFYHVPLTIAMHLKQNQRYSEAQRWFHYIFDPTDDSERPTPERFWKVRPFHTTDVKKIEEILINLVTGEDDDLRTETISSIEAWQDAPFRPHVIARYRQQAYMYKIVMAYLDNLIEWGDSLFRQDTGEAIDEAMMLYVLAVNILGPRPQAVPQKGKVHPQTYANLRKDLTLFGTVLKEIETGLPFNSLPFPAESKDDDARMATLSSIGKALYFCVPPNDKLLSYWDTVADRLFKIRNSLNFQGVFRQLALFEPPIDPALLAKSTAAGLDITAIINGLNQPMPLIRFQLLVQKASEICQEVKSLGNNLLSAMEKEEGEALSVLRAKHENVLMKMVEKVKYAQVQEATKSKEALFKSLALAFMRYSFYEKQLGRDSNLIDQGNELIQELFGELKKESLTDMKFNMDEPEIAQRNINIDIAQNLEETGGKIISSYEQLEMSLTAEARTLQDVVQGIQLGGQAISLLPQFGIKFHFWGFGGDTTYGGFNLAKIAQFAANVASAVADKKNFEANKAAKIGSFARREQDWAFQSNLAAAEINQTFKQLRAAQIREAIAELELKNHRKQMEHAAEIDHFLNEEGTDKKGKKTNKALYSWMKREVRGLYTQSFQFAFDIAKKAERALQHEMGDSSLSYIQYEYLSGKEGLLAGEKLYLDLKHMEMAYHELNRREYELTKHISLLQVNPLALVQLRTTGKCTVRFPEELFDIDTPGHYFRRIKNVSMSIPCITGPYASVNCTLTLVKSSIRISQVLNDGLYQRENSEDIRFSDYFGSTQSIVTSSAQNDSGLFETNLRDERFLPFEYSGVISEWNLELPANPVNGDLTQFDYDTISDIIFHFRYTAREGGSLLKMKAQENLNAMLSEANLAGSVRMISVRHEFPVEWTRFKDQAHDPDKRFELKINVKPEHYPFWSQGKLNTIKRIDILLKQTSKPIPASIDIFESPDKDNITKNATLTKDKSFGNLLTGTMIETFLPASPFGESKFFFETNLISDLWIAITWTD